MNTKIIRVVTSEVEIVTRHYTYEVEISEDAAEAFAKHISELEGHHEIYGVLNEHECRFIERTEGKQYPTDDNTLTSIDQVTMLKQLALSL